MSDVIATRVLDLAGDPPSQVTVTIYRPEPDGRDFRCRFEIIGLSAPIAHFGMGVDEIQALDLTLKYIGTRLYTSKEGKEGRLTWLGMTDLAFPSPDSR